MGVLESVPCTLSNQPRGWQARSDLEGLLSSSQAADWRKIASFFLGPEPEGFDFTVRFPVVVCSLDLFMLMETVMEAETQVEHGVSRINRKG